MLIQSLWSCCARSIYTKCPSQTVRSFLCALMSSALSVLWWPPTGVTGVCGNRREGEGAPGYPIASAHTSFLKGRPYPSRKGREGRGGQLTSHVCPVERSSLSLSLSPRTCTGCADHYVFCTAAQPNSHSWQNNPGASHSWISDDWVSCPSHGLHVHIATTVNTNVLIFSDNRAQSWAACPTPLPAAFKHTEWCQTSLTSVFWPRDLIHIETKLWALFIICSYEEIWS